MGIEGRPWLLRGAVVAVALVTAVVSWLATRDGGAPAAEAGEAGAQIVSASELANAAALSGHPVYWAGPIPGTELELTESPGGNVQVRYLPEGAEAGEEAGEALTIGSYPLANPRAALHAFAAEAGAVVRRSRRVGEVVTSRAKPTSVYFASPDGSVQVEVYDPSPRRAMRLALSGQTRPAG